MFEKCSSVCVCIFGAALCLGASPAAAGVSNPDISVIGQVIMKNTDDRGSENPDTTVLDLGETELVFSAYLNPYAKGSFVFSVGDEGLGVEEAYVNVFKGLPGTLALKAGKYRIGFGKLNPVHPHAYPFIEAPRVLGAMLPGGEEGFNDTGVQASGLLPGAGNWASLLAVDALNGSSFHPDESKAAGAWVGRWGNSLLIKDTVPLEMGVSATQGTNNVQWETRTAVYGADVKTKIPLSNLTNLTLQGEYFYNDSEVLVDTTTGGFVSEARQGFYAFADLRFLQRYNAGIIYDQYQPAENRNVTDRAIKGFVGYALMEETTLLRLAYEQFIPSGSPVVHTWMFQVLFSMGPHKAHQF